MFSSWNVWSNWNAVLSIEGERGDIKDWSESEGKRVNIEKDNKGKTIKKAKDLSRITEKLGKKRKNRRKNKRKNKKLNERKKKQGKWKRKGKWMKEKGMQIT